MLNLFAGRENIDKERFIYDRIRESGGETLVLVPDQYTLVAEEQALRHLGTDCLFNVEILSMNRLGLRILSGQGTESVRMLDKYGRFMLLTMLVREHAGDLDLFSRVSGKVTFTAMLNDFISEFKQQDCSLGSLKELADGAGGDPILSAKLNELSTVIGAYEDAIKDRYTDSEDYIAMYVAAIKDSPLVRGRNIWIYGYDSITPKFAGAVMELAKVAGSVNFIINRSDFGLDEGLEASLRQLAAENGIALSCEEIGSSFEMPKSETVKRIERSLWKDVLSKEEKQQNADFVPEDITLVRAANPYYEAETAAAFIWHLVRDLGYKMRDIQVIANDEGSMQPVIRRVFEEYGLPLFADTSRDITDSAAVGFIVNLLDFVFRRKPSQYLFAMLKTGLTDFADEDIEDLENYVRTYNIKGSMWDKPFVYGKDDIGEEALERLNAMRDRISASAGRLAGLTKAESTGAFIKGFREYLEDDWSLSAKVEEAAAAEEAEGLFDEAQRMVQSYRKAMELLGQIDEIMGAAPMDAGLFADIYTAGLSDVEVGVIPPSADGLSVGTMIRTRPRQMRAAVILGANEGVMPLSPQTEGLFSIDEKEFFKSRGFAIGSLDEIKMGEENAAMYRMMAKPSEKIYISWSMTDTEGRDMSPSPVIDSLRTLFPRIDSDGLIQRDIISPGGGTVFAGRGVDDTVNTAETGMRRLVSRVREIKGMDDPDAQTAALIKWFSENRREELDTMLKASSYDNDPAPLGRDTARSLFARSDGTLVLSASSIGSYVDCPFRYFIDRGLRPKEERSFGTDARSVGDIYHECLRAVAAQIMDDPSAMERIREAGGDGELLEELVQKALDELSENYQGGLFISAGAEEYRMSRIREICAAAAKAMAAQLSADSVKDAVFEEEFGRHRRFEPVRLKVGEDEVYVEGKIDRADLISVGGEDRVRIIDYKTGSDKLDLWKMRQGYKMQLMIYMISATSGGLTPAGMFYFNIKDPIESLNDKSAAQIDKLLAGKAEDEFRLKGAFIDEEGVLGAMPEKVLASAKGSMSRAEYDEVRGEVAARMEETAAGILAGKIGINPLSNDGRLACGYCDYASICRRDRGYYKNAARAIEKKPKKEETED